MAHSGSVQFCSITHWNSKPFYTAIWHQTAELAFGEDGVMPGDADHYDEHLADNLDEWMLEVYKDCFKKVYGPDASYRKAVVNEFLNLYRGQPVRDVKAYRVSTGWSIMYFMEKS